MKNTDNYENHVKNVIYSLPQAPFWPNNVQKIMENMKTLKNTWNIMNIGNYLWRGVIQWFDFEPYTPVFALDKWYMIPMQLDELKKVEKVKTKWKNDGQNAIKYNKSNEIMIFIHEILQVKWNMTHAGRGSKGQGPRARAQRMRDQMLDFITIWLKKTMFSFQKSSYFIGHVIFHE